MAKIAELEWLTPARAAHILGVTPQRIRQLMRAGRLACIRTPLGRLADPTSVERLRAEREERRSQGGEW